MPIYDEHAHIGSGIGPDNLLRLMDEYGIELALVSNLSLDNVLESNREMARISEKYKHLKGLAWCIPNKKGNSALDIEPFFKENKLVGMKLHPSLNMFRVDDPILEPYMELCQQYDVPAQFHTEPDACCSPDLMLKLAKRHPQVKIVMVHMNLGNRESDRDAAIDVAKEASNVYLDTSWAPSEKVIKAVKEVGKERVIFGTDAPVASYVKTLDYEHYDHYFLFDAYPLQQPPFIDNLQRKLSRDEYDHVMYLNAERIYKI